MINEWMVKENCLLGQIAKPQNRWIFILFYLCLIKGFLDNQPWHAIQYIWEKKKKQRLPHLFSIRCDVLTSHLYFIGDSLLWFDFGKCWLSGSNEIDKNWNIFFFIFFYFTGDFVAAVHDLVLSRYFAIYLSFLIPIFDLCRSVFRFRAKTFVTHFKPL